MAGRDNTSPVARTLGDIARLLESFEGADRRVRGVLELLGAAVPYRQCLLLEAEPGNDPRLLAVPQMQPEDEHAAAVSLVKLFGKFLEERALPKSTAAPAPWSAHLAVPLIGLDEVIGVLFVSRADGNYEVAHLRALSLVSAQLSAYLMMLRAARETAARVQAAEEARHAALRARAIEVQGIADEIRAPLEAASAWLRVLASVPLPAGERARAVEAVERSIRTQDRLVRDLFDVTSVGGLHLDLAALQPAGLIETAVDDLRPLAAQRSIRLEAALDGSVGGIVGDAARLDEVLAILLANAFRWTPDGGRVQVRLDPDGSGARVQVIDSGKGFSPGHLAQMFDASGFPPARPRGDSFEIGLAIARHLVELHGGSLRAESAGEGKGATFTVALPRVLAAPLPA